MKGSSVGLRQKQSCHTWWGCVVGVLRRTEWIRLEGCSYRTLKRLYIREVNALGKHTWVKLRMCCLCCFRAWFNGEVMPDEGHMTKTSYIKLASYSSVRDSEIFVCFYFSHIPAYVIYEELLWLFIYVRACFTDGIITKSVLINPMCCVYIPYYNQCWG